MDVTDDAGVAYVLADDPFGSLPDCDRGGSLTALIQLVQQGKDGLEHLLILIQPSVLELFS